MSSPSRVIGIASSVCVMVIACSFGVSYGMDLSAHVDMGELAGDVAIRVENVQYWYDGNTEPFNLAWQADGATQYTRCRRNVNPGTGGPEFDKHFYFDVDDQWYFDGNYTKAKITLFFFDHSLNAGGELKLQYDSLDSSHKEAPNSITLTGTEEWIQHTFVVDNTKFANRQNEGSDFRVVWNHASHLYIDHVRVAIDRNASIITEGYIDLGEDTGTDLVHLHDPPSDGSTVQVTQAGVQCRRNETSTDKHFYFAVDDQTVFAGQHTRALITITYFDNLAGSLRLQYDALDQEYKAHADGITLLGSGTWKSVSLEVEDAFFGNRQNAGADFRISRTDGEFFFIDKVRVHLMQNYSAFIGGIHTGGRYFLADPPIDYLNEGAVENAASGLRTLKLWLWFPSGYKWNSEWPSDINGRTLRGKVEHQYFRELFRRPVDTYVFNILEDWDFVGGFPAARQTELEEEFYQLASFFLEEYDGTNKTFILGTWESDWLLRDRLNHPGLSNDEFLQPAYDPSPTAIQGMIDWYSARQAGVNRARTDHPQSTVNVYHSAEVNTVLRLCIENPHRPCVLKDVLPLVDPSVDLVSYSCWEAINGSGNEPEMAEREADLQRGLEHIAMLMPDTAVMSPWDSPIGDDNVFIGEYGGTEQRWINGGWDGAAKLRRVVKVTVGGEYTDTSGIDRFFEGAFGFGSPYSFFWQVFDTACCPPNIPVCTPGFTGDECCCKAGSTGQDCCGDPGDPGNQACHDALRTPSDFNSSYPEDAPPVDDNSLCNGYWLRRPDGTFSGARDAFVNEYIPEYSIPPVSFEVNPLADGTFQLTWNDQSYDEDQYVIEKSNLADPSVFTTVVTVPPSLMPMTIVDSNVQPDTNYLYRIRSEQTDYTTPPWFHKSAWYFDRGMSNAIFADGFESGDTNAWDYAGSGDDPKL